MDIDAEKKRIRLLVKERKASFEKDILERRSIELFEKVKQLSVFIKAKTIMAYWSIPGEVWTHRFVVSHYPQKTIILPVVKGDVLQLKEFTGIESMKPGQSFGILEPQGPEFHDLDSIDLIIVPGVAFDKHNNRLGRGRAYYDKLLAYTNAYKLGVCFDFQMFDAVPVDVYDVKMDEVVTA